MESSNTEYKAHLLCCSVAFWKRSNYTAEKNSGLKHIFFYLLVITHNYIKAIGVRQRDEVSNASSCSSCCFVTT